MSEPLTLTIELTPDQLDMLAHRVAEIVRGELPSPSPRTPWPDWLSVDRSADYLGVSPERVRKLIARHQIPFYREGPGCRTFLHRPELDAWMRETRIPRAQDEPRGSSAS